MTAVRQAHGIQYVNAEKKPAIYFFFNLSVWFCVIDVYRLGVEL